VNVKIACDVTDQQHKAKTVPVT